MPEGERTGADTEPTPGSRSPMLCAQPRRRTADELGGGERRLHQALVHALGVLPGEQDLGGRAGGHRQLAADRDGVAQAGRPVGGGDADPEVALAAIQLGRLAGDVAQAGQHGSGRREQPVLASGRGQLAESRAEHEPALDIAADEAMMFEGDRESMGRRAGQPGGRHEAGERCWSRFECGQHERGFVENADSARVVHVLILPYRIVRRNSTLVGGTVGKTLAEKIWDDHVVRSAQGEPDLLYIDLHLIHEVTSPQAFDGLRLVRPAGPSS